MTITIVPSYEDGQRVTDDDSNDTYDPKGVSQHLPCHLLGEEASVCIINNTDETRHRERKRK